MSAALPIGRVSCPYASSVKVLDVPYHGPDGTRVVLRSATPYGVSLGSDSSVDLTTGWSLIGEKEFVFTFPEGQTLEIWARGGNSSGTVTLTYLVCHAV